MSLSCDHSALEFSVGSDGPGTSLDASCVAGHQGVEGGDVSHETQILQKIADRFRSAQHPEVEVQGQAHMSAEHAIALKASLFEESHARLQSYMDEQYRLYRQTAPLDGVTPEPVVRAQWARDTYHFHLEQSLQMESPASMLTAELPQITVDSPFNDKELGSIVDALQPLCSHGVAQLLAIIDGLWHQTWSSMPECIRSNEPVMKAQWLRAQCTTDWHVFLSKSCLMWFLIRRWRRTVGVVPSRMRLQFQS